MRAHPFRLRRHLRQEGGFSLIEVLIACAIISTGLFFVMYGLSMGIQGVETGRQQSTAIFLAQQRMDQVKAASQNADDLASVNAGAFPAEAYGAIIGPGAIAGALNFRRTVNLTFYVGPAAGLPQDLKAVRIDVDVFYRPIMADGVLTTERSVRLSNFLTSR
jgi:prepilin-type N-terminal cleavage/methylation domain-containing protein